MMAKVFKKHVFMNVVKSCTAYLFIYCGKHDALFMDSLMKVQQNSIYFKQIFYNIKCLYGHF